MTRSLATLLAATALLGACAQTLDPKGDFSANNRPLEERCANQKAGTNAARAPDTTRADVQAEARAAAQRGELDKACGWL